MEDGKDTPDIFDMPAPDLQGPAKKKKPKKKSKSLQVTSENKELVEKAREAGMPITSVNTVNILTKFVERQKHGHQGAISMTCKGTRCSYLSMCPIHEAGENLPINKRCPVENILIEMWASKFIAALNIDISDPEYAIDMDMVYELAGLELIRNRAACKLSDEPEIFTSKAVAFSPQGETIYDDKPNMALLILERYGKRVDKLREQLIATRSAQAKIGKIAGDSSVRAANLAARAQQILEKRMNKGSIEEVEFEVKDDEGK
jgi:hypothetical protein